MTGLEEGLREDLDEALRAVDEQCTWAICTALAAIADAEVELTYTW